MKKTLSLLLITLSTSVYAADKKPHQGEELHDKKCINCHKSDVYTRDDRMVKTMEALEHQVDNCMKGAAKAEWTKPQTTSVVDF